MPVSVSLHELMEFTEWERDRWQAWFTARGEHALQTSFGAHGDGRFATVGDVVRHVFAAEKRYVERLSGRPLTEQAAVPIAFAALFQFGRQSRKELREFVVAFPAGQWDTPAEHTILTHTLRLTPRKIIVHVLLHEIRHWAQIATVLRLGGEKVEMHDFLFSPVMGGDPRAGGRA